MYSSTTIYYRSRDRKFGTRGDVDVDSMQPEVLRMRALMQSLESIGHTEPECMAASDESAAGCCLMISARHAACRCSCWESLNAGFTAGHWWRRRAWRGGCQPSAGVVTASAA
eukprot:SAG22_NODE_205_length_15308_cov_20.539023_27_plen_113_part_00